MTLLGHIAEQLRRKFHLSDAQIGGSSTGFTVRYAIAGWPLGRMADTKSRKSLLAWVVAVWSGLAALGGLASSSAMLLAIRLGVGIDEAVCAPAATIWIGEAVKPEHRMPAMAGFMMAVPVAIMLSFALGGLASQAFGWRWLPGSLFDDEKQRWDSQKQQSGGLRRVCDNLELKTHAGMRNEG